MLNVIVVAVRRNVTFIYIFSYMSLGQREYLATSRFDSDSGSYDPIMNCDASKQLLFLYMIYLFLCHNFYLLFTPETEVTMHSGSKPTDDSVFQFIF